ncbi:hypothetical protein B0H19DRAFT_1224739 [Mycena capillaripes]|nr:hypothetical protein B0H19DRAFT_1224739 [Mycena capillaripes]
MQNNSQDHPFRWIYNSHARPDINVELSIVPSFVPISPSYDEQLISLASLTFFRIAPSASDPIHHTHNYGTNNPNLFSPPPRFDILGSAPPGSSEEVQHTRRRDQDHRGNIGTCKGYDEQYKASDGARRRRVPLASKTYLQTIGTIFLAIDQCASEVKDIQTAMLVRILALNIASLKTKQPQLIIEEERQRKLTEGIKDSQDALNTVVRSPTYAMPVPGCMHSVVSRRGLHKRNPGLESEPGAGQFAARDSVTIEERQIKKHT